jgi:hypothetical protein
MMYARVESSVSHRVESVGGSDQVPISATSPSPGGGQPRAISGIRQAREEVNRDERG